MRQAQSGRCLASRHASAAARRQDAACACGEAPPLCADLESRTPPCCYRLRATRTRASAVRRKPRLRQAQQRAYRSAIRSTTIGRSLAWRSTVGHPKRWKIPTASPLLAFAARYRGIAIISSTCWTIALRESAKLFEQLTAVMRQKLADLWSARRHEEAGRENDGGRPPSQRPADRGSGLSRSEGPRSPIAARP